MVLKTIGFMAAGGCLGWGGGFLWMITRADMDLANFIAIFYPIGGAVTGIVAGAVVAAAT